MKRLLTTAVALTFLALGLTGAPAAHATSPTVVTIQFDDGYADQFQAMAILGSLGTRPSTSTAGSSGTPITCRGTRSARSKARRQRDRRPHHLPHEREEAEARARHARDLRRPGGHRRRGGQRSGLVRVSVRLHQRPREGRRRELRLHQRRGVSGVNDRKVFAESIPPLDAFATRTPPNYPKQGTTVATIESSHRRRQGQSDRRLAGCSWSSTTSATSATRYSITPDDLAELAASLTPRAGSGTVVMTTAQVMAERSPQAAPALSIAAIMRCAGPRCRGPPPSRGGPRRRARRPTAPASRPP